MAEIKFTPEQLTVISEAVNQSSEYTNKQVSEKSRSISWLMTGVIIVCLIGFIQLIVDSAHINSATYREYSEKLSATNISQDLNKQLLDQNKSREELIIDQQKQILFLLNQR